ncbi:MAG TPA: phosphatidylglycerophosphatase A [Pirellulales bacterium]|nr:phosphatidylglycerophosphatase A [Pirellulales bacterium]
MAAPKVTWAVWLATGLGIGFAPVAPGTWGTLWGLPLAWTIARLPGVVVPALVVIAVNLLGIPLCTAGARWFQKKDPGSVVFDEIGAMPIVLFLVPLDFARPAQTWLVLGLAFILFRLFDISKIPPARQLERLPDGLGIMADDWAAAVYAGVVLRLILLWNPGGFWGG